MSTAAARDTPLGTAVGLVAVAAFMVLPVILIGYGTLPGDSQLSPVTTSATAALGVIFRASARNLLRGTLMTTMRATSRTVSRRVARRALKVLGAFLLGKRDAANAIEGQHPAVALAAGVTVVIASFWAVLHLVEPELGPLPNGVVAALGAVPLAVHFASIGLLARQHGVKVSFATTLDGVVLQLYFTIAGSFLPLSSDADLDGPVPAKARVAASVIGILWLCGLLGVVVGDAVGLPVLDTLGYCFLIYAFVFSFPLHPLDGGDVFAYSRRGWLAGFVLILATFAWALPEAWYALL